MPSEIVGYATRAYIKGQYYRYAGAPKPDSFTGNIDEISEDLLVKAMYVTRSQASGTFPDNTINVYLIETIKYGNNSYLQIAYAIQQGYDCYEFKRIYSGGWTEWIAVDVAIRNVASLANSAAGTASSVAASVDKLSSTVSSLASNLSATNKSVSTLSGTVGSLQNSVNDLNKKVNQDRCKTLLDQDMSSGSRTFQNNSYSSLVVLAKVRNGGSFNSCTIPMLLIADITRQFCISDDEDYIVFTAKLEDNTITITMGSKSQSGGCISFIYGFI